MLNALYFMEWIIKLRTKNEWDTHLQDTNKIDRWFNAQNSRKVDLTEKVMFRPAVKI